MQYWIVNGKFTASFTYPEEIDPNENTMDRRERILNERYGNRRIVRNDLVPAYMIVRMLQSGSLARLTPPHRQQMANVG